jgi:hypothetical protein
VDLLERQPLLARGDELLGIEERADRVLGELLGVGDPLAGVGPFAQARVGRGKGESWILDAVSLAGRAAPLVSVLDGHPHTPAFLAGVNHVPARHLGVTGFGQSGDFDDVYRHHELDTDSIVAAGLDLLG